MSVFRLGLCFEGMRASAEQWLLGVGGRHSADGSCDMGHGTVNMSHVRHNKHVTFYNKHVSPHVGAECGTIQFVLV